MNDETMNPEGPPEPRYIGFERGLSKPELDAICKKLFPLEFEKIQKGHLRTSVDLFMEEQLPNAIQLIPHGDPKAPDTLFAIGYDITGRSENYVAKEETSLRLKLGNARVGIERVFGRMLRIDEFEEPALPRPAAPAPAPAPAPDSRHRGARPYQGRDHDGRSSSARPNPHPQGPRPARDAQSHNNHGHNNHGHSGSRDQKPRHDSARAPERKPKQFSR